ncbi:alpha/beta fold hydrolase [Sphingomonas hengshuiensis]|uniref:Lactone esterase n=1 Tax=Sphingomonas hengshuiensis TaxID=1609977 RepID=A0A7U4JB88_9SPHN|nr:alpha/beta hydrolase [Sphingomonas hengshuiensis]AJP73622.1 lactone esterase [Sphingomonas hengshuiensis]
MLIPFGLAGLVAGGLATWSAVLARKAETLAPADGVIAEVPGGRLHYVDMGPRGLDGPPIVMLHGLMGQMRNFSHSLTDGIAGDHRVILIDRPGWGHSSVDGRQPGIVAQAEMIAALLDQLEVRKVLLVGHSMGGAVALALAIARPDLVGALALVAPLTQPVDSVPPVFAGLLAPPPLRPLVAWTLAVPMGSMKALATAAAIFAPDPVPADFATRGGGALALRPKSYLAGSAEIRETPAEIAALVPRYPEIAMPVAILYGRGDAVLDPAVQGERTAAAIPGAVLTLIEGGHMLPVTHAGETEAWLREVLARM